MIRLSSVILALFILNPSSVFPQDSSRAARWTPEAMIKYKRVGGTALSPDGKLVAYTVSTPMMEGEKSEFVSQIWIASSDGKQNTQFTFGEKSCTDPSFSPDGKYLAFLSSRGKDEKNQIWIMRVNGGEAEQVTNKKSSVSFFDWSPDSKCIAFAMTDPKTEQQEKDDKEKRDMHVVDADFRYAHLYTISVEKSDKGERKLKRLTSGNFHVTGFDWSPDGKSIAFSHQVNPTADVWTTQDISVVSSDSGEVKSLVAWKGSDSDPIYSPDGRWIGFASDGNDPRWAGQSDLYIIPASGGDARKLAETPDRGFNAVICWSNDGKQMYVTEAHHTCQSILAVPADGGKPRLLNPMNGNYGGVSFSRDGRTMAFTYQTPSQPPDVYVSGTGKFEPRRLTEVNADFPKLPLSRTEPLTWKSKDGTEIEGLLTYPANFEKGKSCPLILNIHGGPAGVFTQSFTAAGSVYPVQAFAQEGYAVLRPNPRGSSGYGKPFRWGNIGNWGYGDYEDDMAGVDKLIEMGIANADSLVVCGWSYGGYMTSTIVTKTKRFKAASVGAGVTNLMSFNGTADIPSFIPDYFGGDSWDSIETYMRHSAMFNVKSVTTPTQVIHGEADVRVPVSQGKELYNALKRQGCKTEMITYPRQPHGFQEPKFILDVGKRVIAWFNKQLGRGSVGTN